MSKIGLFSINQQIERLRKEMLNLVSTYGFGHPEVIKCSERLDKFILIIQEQNSKKIG